VLGVGFVRLVRGVLGMRFMCVMMRVMRFRAVVVRGSGNGAETQARKRGDDNGSNDLVHELPQGLINVADNFRGRKVTDRAAKWCKFGVISEENFGGQRSKRRPLFHLDSSTALIAHTNR